MALNIQIAALVLAGAAIAGGTYAYNPDLFSGADAPAETTVDAQNDTIAPAAPAFIPQFLAPETTQAQVPYITADLSGCDALVGQISAEVTVTPQALRNCMNTVSGETRKIKESVLTQYTNNGPIATLSESFAVAANEISAVINMDCVITETSFDSFLQQNQGKSVDELLSTFYQNISTCLGTLENMSEPTNYTNISGQDRVLSEAFTNAATPINGQWVEIVQAYNAFLGSEIGRNPEASATFDRLQETMVNTMNRAMQ